MTDHRITLLTQLARVVELPASDDRTRLAEQLTAQLTATTPGLVTRTYAPVTAHPLDPALLAVDGPRGTYLVTRGRLDPSWSVWRSDSTATAYRTSDVRLAWQRAAALADYPPVAAPDLLGALDRAVTAARSRQGRS